MSTIIETIDKMFAEQTPAEVEGWMLATRDRLLADTGDDVADLIAVCNELGSLYREESRYEESIHNFNLAMEHTERLMGTKVCDEYAILQLNVAGTYRNAGRLDEALACYQAAFETLTELGREGTYEFAGVLNNLSNVLQDMGDYPRALELAKNAYDIVRELTPGQTEEAVSLMNLAALGLRAGDLVTADRCAKNAIGIYERLGETTGHYSAAVNLASVISFKQGDYEAALAGFQRCAQLISDRLGKNRDYASTLINMAVVLEALGRTDEAEAARKEAAQVKAALR